MREQMNGIKHELLLEVCGLSSVGDRRYIGNAVRNNK
jgi:hypothetical protein